MRLNNVSSLNLRLGRESGKKLPDPIPFKCSCGLRGKLGGNRFVMVKLQYTCNGDPCREVIMCDDCVDRLVDFIRFGPRAGEPNWKKSSRVARVSRVVGDFKCYKCQGREDSHLFVKYDDLRAEGSKEAYTTVRVCARCAITYMHMVLPKEAEKWVEAKQ